MRLWWSGRMPSVFEMFAFTASMVSDASTPRVIVFPARVFTNICIVSRRRYKRVEGSVDSTLQRQQKSKAQWL